MSGKFEIKKTNGGKFHFVLKAGNGEVILSGQTYADSAGAKAGVESVRTHATDATNFEKKGSSDGSPYFVLVAKNKQVIGTSEMYKSASARDNGIASVMSNAPSAKLVES